MALRNRILLLATLAFFGTAGVLSPAFAQVKAPAKAKLKPAAPKAAAKADPTDTVSDQLNAKWQQENGVYAGFTQAAPAVAAVVPVSFATPAVANDWGDRLVSRAMNYLGTPYRYGGTSPKTGFDCSGFVYYLYGAVFGQRIPRMPHEMAREGTPVARSDLQRGDLVFFGSRGTFTHIGIYAGNDQFVHATHRGSPVMVTHLDSDYFRTRFMTAVRLSPQ
ncbi:MAG: peptidoglycan endopeptidase [Reyranella sp.]|uniref:C40 family peptidase n=1 Tax=Reyranella sp. TaxID=1929291 RepID=UPI0012071CA4|nr:C40 family peptidase [Reyranella sp.]TAJ36398.1 MAG: peptidoglycan endopeptidase [Reyranella sp.]